MSTHKKIVQEKSGFPLSVRGDDFVKWMATRLPIDSEFVYRTKIDRTDKIAKKFLKELETVLDEKNTSVCVWLDHFIRMRVANQIFRAVLVFCTKKRMRVVRVSYPGQFEYRGNIVINLCRNKCVIHFAPRE